MKFINKDKYYNLKGVYVIKNIINNKVYIGSTHVKFSQRYILHKSRLNRNVHHSPHLQNSWNLYKKENFIFEVLEVLNNNTKITEREEYWINKYNSVLKGYNVTKLVNGKRFKKHSIITRNKMNKDKYKPICQYDLQGNYIKTFKSMKHTKKEGFNPKAVSNCCCNRIKSYKKFIWMFYTENFSLKIPGYSINRPGRKWILDTLTNKKYKGYKAIILDLKVTMYFIYNSKYNKQKRFKKI